MDFPVDANRVHDTNENIVRYEPHYCICSIFPPFRIITYIYSVRY